MAQPTATPLSRTIELRVTGQPDVPNQYGSGHIRPTEVTFRYQAGGIRAQVYGRWIREDGELTDAPITRDYVAHQGDMTGWPDWLTALADKRDPVAQEPTNALDVADAIVTALSKRAKELSALAEEEMRSSLEDQAQEWHEAADVARRTAAKARQNGAQ